VILSTDVAEYFPGEQSVNTALRKLIHVTKVKKISWGKPMLVEEVDPSPGPVLVTVEYEVEPRNADEFLEALHKFARVRRRDGASRWGVYRDTEHPAIYVETFIVESWAEHLRQRASF
jgi:hypothetical protein